MRFKVVSRNDDALRLPWADTAFLEIDEWNDWFRFQTQYFVTLFDESGIKHDLGNVKIGQLDWSPEQRRPELTDEFTQLPDGHFSLGQEDSYYRRLHKLPRGISRAFVSSMRDVVAQPALVEAARTLDVFRESLLRSVSLSTVLGQYTRLLAGEAPLTPFYFTFTPPAATQALLEPPAMTFDVEPNSHPPSNVHVLVGRNGVGKTRLLRQLSEALIMSESSQPSGKLTFDTRLQRRSEAFANLVVVSFSAFDQQPEYQASDVREIGYIPVGLRDLPRLGPGTGADLPPISTAASEGEATLAPDASLTPRSEAQSLDDHINRQFIQGLAACQQGTRITRWQRTIRILESDPIFRDYNFSSMDIATEGGRAEVVAAFASLSSGHRLVLLSTTRLVASVEERSLVLLDEPETHLHPPLLSSFIRALSNLLESQNGVAIVATHSPVVLQEVPATCCWLMHRSGDEVAYRRPTLETFGENIGVLTKEIFGLEVTETGFHKMLAEQAALDEASYENILQFFERQLGAEARGVLRGLLASRDS